MLRCHATEQKNKNSLMERLLDLTFESYLGINLTQATLICCEPARRGVGRSGPCFGYNSLAGASGCLLSFAIVTGKF